MFLAELSDTLNGPATGNGLFRYDAAGGLVQIARTGDAFAESTIQGLSYAGTVYTVTQSSDTTYGGLNESGQVAFAFSLANGNSGIARFSDAGVPGDYNGNGVVDAADYTVWRDNLGGSSLPNEGASFGDVDQEDYDFWVLHFGETSAGEGGGAFAPAAAVPEPSALWLAMVALGIVRVGRGRRVRGDAVFDQSDATGLATSCITIECQTLRPVPAGATSRNEMPRLHFYPADVRSI